MEYNMIKTPQDPMLQEISRGYDVPLSVMRTMYDVMTDWNDEQHDLFQRCCDDNNWTEWDDKYITKDYINDVSGNELLNEPNTEDDDIVP